MKTNSYDSLGKSFAKYVSFNVLGMVGTSVYILADTYFVAKGLGANGLAALNLAIPIFSLIHGLGLMMAMGSATKFSILSAMNDEKKANQFFMQGLCTTLFFSILYLLAGILLSTLISRICGAEGDTLLLTSVYLKTILTFTPMFCLNHFLTSFVRNDGNPKLAMYATLAGSFANIVFDYIFIFPMNLGMFGAALATGMSPVTGILVLSIHILKGHNHFHLRKTGFHFEVFCDTLKLGFASFVNEISSGVVIFVFNIIILSLTGTIGVAAYGVVANIALVITSLFTGIGQGIQPLISHYYGKNEMKKTEKTYHYALLTALCLSVVSYLVTILLKNPLIAVFNGEGNQQLATIAKAGITLYFIGFLPSGFNVVTSFFLTSSEQAAKGLTISLLRGLVFIVLFAVMLSNLLGMNGVWLSFPCAEVATAIFAGFLLYLHLKKGVV